MPQLLDRSDRIGFAENASHSASMRRERASGEGPDAAEQFGIGFGDHNGDDTPENPGDGFGVWPYTNESLLQIDNTIESSETGTETRDRLGEARVCLVNLRNEVTIVLEQAATTNEEAQPASDAMLRSANAGTYGVDASGNTVIDPLPGEYGAQQADCRIGDTPLSWTLYNLLPLVGRTAFALASAQIQAGDFSNIALK